MRRQTVMAGMSLRLSVMFAAMFVFHGVALTYLPVWLDARGLSPAQIAIATSAPLFMRLALTPTIGFVADQAQAHRAILMALCSAAIVLVGALSLVPSQIAIIMLTALMLVTIQSMMPLADTIALSAARTDASVNYGRVRSWGSLTFILASYAAGFATATSGAGSIIWLLLAGTIVMWVAYAMLPGKPAADKVEGSTASMPRLRLSDVVELLRNRRFALFLAASGAIQSSHALFYVFGVIHWREQGMSAGFIGTLWAIGVAAEIALFWAGKQVAGFGDVRLMMLGAVTGIFRWWAMTFDPPAALLVPLQVLHAGTFAATHLGAMQWISQNIPAHMSGTAQALLSTFTAGIAMSSATLLSGPLYASLGGGAYIAMAALCAMGFAAALLLERAAKDA